MTHFFQGNARMTFVHFHCEFSTNSLDLDVDGQKKTLHQHHEKTQTYTEVGQDMDGQIQED